MSEPRIDYDQAQPRKLHKGEILGCYAIRIEFLSIGCIIKVGCKSIPFSSVKEAMKALNDYVTNPEETIKIWEEILEKEE